MTTTNGTRALLACTAAASVYAGSLWNEAAMARRLRVDGRDVLLVCAGTDGVFAEEDEAAAASLAMRLQSLTPAVGLSTTAQAAVEAVADRDLLPIFRASDGGRNLIAAGLEDDIPVSARRRELPFVARLKEGGIIHREEVQTSV